MNSTIRSISQTLRQVGEFQCQHFRTQKTGYGTEKALRELVSFVDIESEKMLKKSLANILPEAGFYGEESGRSGNQELCWIVDPLDGTSNYLSGIEHFSISVALVENGISILGAVYRPVSEEIFTAIKGEGLYRNGVKLNPFVEEVRLKDCLLATGFPYRSKDLRPAFYQCADALLEKTRGLRRFGSAALDLSYTASGYFQGFWESDLEPYDVAAGVLFLEEQGLICTNHQGKPYQIDESRVIVAALPSVHEQMLQEVDAAYSSFLS